MSGRKRKLSTIKTVPAAGEDSWEPCVHSQGRKCVKKEEVGPHVELGESIRFSNKAAKGPRGAQLSWELSGGVTRAQIPSGDRFDCKKRWDRMLAEGARRPRDVLG